MMRNNGNSSYTKQSRLNKKKEKIKPKIIEEYKRFNLKNAKEEISNSKKLPCITKKSSNSRQSKFKRKTPKSAKKPWNKSIKVPGNCRSLTQKAKMNNLKKSQCIDDERRLVGYRDPVLGNKHIEMYTGGPNKEDKKRYDRWSTMPKRKKNYDSLVDGKVEKQTDIIDWYKKEALRDLEVGGYLAHETDRSFNDMRTQEYEDMQILEALKNSSGVYKCDKKKKFIVKGNLGLFYEKSKEVNQSFPKKYKQPLSKYDQLRMNSSQDTVNFDCSLEGYETGEETSIQLKSCHEKKTKKIRSIRRFKSINQTSKRSSKGKKITIMKDRLGKGKGESERKKRRKSSDRFNLQMDKKSTENGNSKSKKRAPVGKRASTKSRSYTSGFTGRGRSDLKSNKSRKHNFGMAKKDRGKARIRGKTIKDINSMDIRKKKFKKKIRKKKTKKPKLSDMHPINMEEEKLVFYRNLKPYDYFENSGFRKPKRIETNSGKEVLYATYNPQFIYSFEPDSYKFKIPFSDKVCDKYVKEAKRILNATLTYHGEDREENIYHFYNDQMNLNDSIDSNLEYKEEKNPKPRFFYGADNAYYDSFGVIVDRETTEKKFKIYIEELGLRFISDVEKNNLASLYELEKRLMMDSPDSFLKNLAGIGEYAKGVGSPKSRLQAPFPDPIKSYKSSIASITLKFSDKSIAPTKVVHTPQTLESKMVVALPVVYRQKRLINVLNHEIGTHYTRKFNDFHQPWYRKRALYNLKSFKSFELLCTEEGLASINQTFEQSVECFDYRWNRFNYKMEKLGSSDHSITTKPSPPFLFQAALHYYASYLASRLPFNELYNTLKRYMSDEVRLWRECTRVKRGVMDTSQKKGFYKDQVYLIGAIKILRNRNRINFYDLYRGKICLEDYFKIFKGKNEDGILGKIGENNTDLLDLKHKEEPQTTSGETDIEKEVVELVKLKKEDAEMLGGFSIENPKFKIPYFLREIDRYRRALDKIAEVNMVDL